MQEWYGCPLSPCQVRWLLDFTHYRWGGEHNAFFVNFFICPSCLWMVKFVNATSPWSFSNMEIILLPLDRGRFVVVQNPRKSCIWTRVNLPCYLWCRLCWTVPSPMICSMLKLLRHSTTGGRVASGLAWLSTVRPTLKSLRHASSEPRNSCRKVSSFSPFFSTVREPV